MSQSILTKYSLVGLFLISLFYLCDVIYTSFSQSIEYLSLIFIVKLIPILSLLVIYRLLNGIVFKQLILASRLNIKTVTALRLWLKAEVFKWIPGGVGSLVAKFQQLKQQAQATNTQAMAITSLDTIINFLSWLVIFILSSLFIDWNTLANLLFSYIPNRNLMLIISLLTSIIFFFSYKIFLRKVNKLKNGFQKIIEINISYLHCFKATIQFSALVMLNGLIFYLLIILFNESNNIAIFEVLSLNCLSWLIGFVAVFAPGGVGVREAVIVAGLSPSCGLEQAIVISIVWRLVQLLSEACSLVFLVNLKEKYNVKA